MFPWLCYRKANFHCGSCILCIWSLCIWSLSIQGLSLLSIHLPGLWPSVMELNSEQQSPQGFGSSLYQSRVETLAKGLGHQHPLSVKLWILKCCDQWPGLKCVSAWGQKSLPTRSLSSRINLETSTCQPLAPTIASYWNQKLSPTWNGEIAKPKKCSRCRLRFPPVFSRSSHFPVFWPTRSCFPHLPSADCQPANPLKY